MEAVRLFKGALELSSFERVVSLFTIQVTLDHIWETGITSSSSPIAVGIY
jgi:hypothetical protein